jgi:hypothetical protein
MLGDKPSFKISFSCTQEIEGKDVTVELPTKEELIL